MSSRGSAAPNVGPLRELDFATVGRDEWKNNVLANTAVRTIGLPGLAPGEHTVDVRAPDPGLVPDRIEVRFDGAPVYHFKPLVRRWAYLPL